MRNIITWFKFKGWFIFDLPYFIKEQQFTKGVELGAKAGRSMYYMLKVNQQLKLTGIDLWEVIEGGAYRENNRNELKCIAKLRSFGERVTLIKSDAIEVALGTADELYDFVYYDLNCKPMIGHHQSVIAAWLPKIRKGGMLIGRDFREFGSELYALGFEEEDIRKCIMGNRVSERLEYILIN